MIKTSYFLSIFILFFFISVYPTNVRVLLKKDKRNTKASWKVSSKNGLRLRHPENKYAVRTNKREIVIAEKDANLYLNGSKLLKSSVTILPVDGYLEFNGNQYDGSFNIAASDGYVYLVNVVNLEDYIFSVLRTEGWPGWPGEVNKVFAIACRSYVIDRLLKSRKKDALYDVCDTNVHQTYQGKHPVKSLRLAVDETKGVFLAYKGKPILAMFDSCCGGIIPSKTTGIDFKKAPYLARDYACKYCKSCRIYKWNIEYSDSYYENEFLDVLDFSDPDKE